MILDDLGTRYRTDKGSLRHHYLGFYEHLFRWRKDVETRLLEIGVQFGFSLKMWLDYFEYPIVTGIDDTDNGVEIDRAEIIIGNAYTLDTMARLTGREFDIIIDDGDHSVAHQQFVITEYSKLLANDGILIIEDVLGVEPIPQLLSALPKDFDHAVVDLRTEERNASDSVLFLVWRK